MADSQRDKYVDAFVERVAGTRVPMLRAADSRDLRAACRFVSILDYTKGLGHTDGLTVGIGGVASMDPARTDDWGLATVKRKLKARK